MLRRFVDAVNRKDRVTLASLFDERNAGIAFPAAGRCVAPESFCEQVDLSLSVTKLISSGYVTSCSFTGRSGDKESAGVGLFEFNSRTRKLHGVRLYADAALPLP